MRKNKRWTTEEKFKIISCYINGDGSLNALAKRFKCTRGMIRRWTSAYRQYGIEGLQKRKTRKVYTDEFKKKLIMEVLGGRSQQEVLDKYHVHPQSHALLSIWVKEYTSGIKTTSK